MLAIDICRCRGCYSGGDNNLHPRVDGDKQVLVRVQADRTAALVDQFTRRVKPAMGVSKQHTPMNRETSQLRTCPRCLWAYALSEDERGWVVKFRQPYCCRETRGHTGQR